MPELLKSIAEPYQIESDYFIGNFQVKESKMKMRNILHLFLLAHFKNTVGFELGFKLDLGLFRVYMHLRWIKSNKHT